MIPVAKIIAPLNYFSDSKQHPPWDLNCYKKANISQIFIQGKEQLLSGLRYAQNKKFPIQTSSLSCSVREDTYSQALSRKKKIPQVNNMLNWLS